MKLSFVIITFNEEKNIERCLKSIQDVADEIVVLDSFSKDRTEEICRTHAVSFHQRAWQGYSESKNFANSLTTNDWIFSIDADECLSEDLKNSLLKWKKENQNSIASIKRLTNYCGSWMKHGGWYPDIKYRLFNRTETQWVGSIHEELKSSVSSKNEFLHGDLLHYSYYNISDHLKQIDKFTSLTAAELFEKGKNASLARLLFSPCVKFFRDYVLKKGFLDGYHGFVVATLSAYATFIKYAKLRELHAGK